MLQKSLHNKDAKSIIQHEKCTKRYKTSIRMFLEHQHNDNNKFLVCAILEHLSLSMPAYPFRVIQGLVIISCSL